jgi:putative ABC transport system ATP-binding protein
VLDHIDLVAAPSSLTCVIGHSGVGKSTLLYCLAGVLQSQGRIELMGQLLTAAPAQRAAVRLAHCGFIFQRGELLPELSIIENVALPLRLAGKNQNSAFEAAEQMLRELGIEQCADRSPPEVSGGQAQRASVARALIHRPSIVFADEPTASLDAASREGVLAALRAAVAAGAAVICATHDPELVRAADAQLDLGEGAVAAGAHA